MSNPSITADKTPWYQWDTGLTVTVSGGEMNECHFANRKQGTAYVQAVINGIARVPDELLQVAAPVKAYGYVSDGAGGQTYVEQTFDVIARNIPSDYAYTKTAQKTIRDAEAARDDAVQAAKDAKASELAADDSAVEASNSAQSAGESASAAATSESNAAKSAGYAAKSASDAKAAADKAVEDASELLKTYTDNAKTSADNAATSASNAADAASAASGSASAAEQSATDASNAKAAAQTAKADAEKAKDAAATSASNAATSAENAANSAEAAANSVNSINVIAPKTVANAPTSDHDFNVTIGEGASTVKYGSIAIGYHANAQRESVSIGDAAVSDDNSIALGHLSAAMYNGSVAIGAASKCYAQNEFSVGSIDFTREITHVSTPAADTSASTKKYTDDNDTKTLSEAKKYTDENTSNALVGTVSGKLLHVEDAWPGKPFGLTIDGAYKQDGTPSPENPVPITVIENPVLKVTGNDTSTEGATLPITLPAEHPYLAALPDGTHDEIVIDKDGNASLVARVLRLTVPDGTSWNIQEQAGGFALGYISNISGFDVIKKGLYASSIMSDRLSSRHDWENNPCFGVSGVLWVVPRTNQSDITSEDVAAVANGMTFYAPLITPVTYPIGKLDIPSLPETISNVWTDAELTTNMSMTYKQDVNIIIADLTAQLAALKGTNNIVHDDSTASHDDVIDVLDNSETLDVSGTVGEV